MLSAVIAGHPAGPIRTLIVDDQPAVCDGLRRMLWPLCDVIGYALDVPSALRRIVEELPELVLLDVRLGGRNGFEVLERIIAERLSVKVIVTSVLGDRVTAEMAKRLGAAGFVSKHRGRLAYRAGVLAVMAGDRYEALDADVQAVERSFGGGEGAQLDRAATTPNEDGYSVQQTNVLTLMGEGLSPAGVATALGISLKTVYYHTIRLRKHFNLKTLGQLVALAARRGSSHSRSAQRCADPSAPE